MTTKIKNWNYDEMIEYREELNVIEKIKLNNIILDFFEGFLGENWENTLKNNLTKEEINQIWDYLQEDAPVEIKEQNIFDIVILNGYLMMELDEFLYNLTNKTLNISNEKFEMTDVGVCEIDEEEIEDLTGVSYFTGRIYFTNYN